MKIKSLEVPKWQDLLKRAITKKTQDFSLN